MKFLFEFVIAPQITNLSIEFLIRRFTSRSSRWKKRYLNENMDIFAFCMGSIEKHVGIDFYRVEMIDHL